ncbi:MFS transporter [Halomonas sp. ND22Bw]|uniref:Major facilitator transporter n=1 Tax=Halomonas salina TaxID=42565 RepID=A0ABR4WU93_9GAMM|nr:MFS transporter [Halomonas salina]KGE78313.1 major facilitator transporter [Halomonas salina]PSJ22074.1 MFS transporter [Halomonas sp. ND22Bw]
MIDAHSRAWWRATLALSLGSFLVFLNLYVVQPLLPSLHQAHGVSTLVANLTMSLATLSLAAALLVFGPLSDAIGRGGIMRLTLLAAGGLSLALAVAPNFEALLALRVVQGFVLGGLPAVAIAWMGDEFERSAMLPAVGLYIAANSLGGISGRVIGGWAAESAGVSASFLWVGGLTLAGVALFWWLLPASRGFTPRRFRLGEALGDLAGHLGQPELRGAYLLGGLNFLVFINLYSYLTFRLAAEPFALDARWLGLLFLTYLGGTLGSSMSGRLVRRASPPTCMALGTLLLASGMALTLASSLPIILGGLTLAAFGFFLAHSMASGWVGRQARRARGSASALYLVFYYLGASLGGLWLEPFWRAGAWPGVLLGGALVLAITLTLALRLRRGERRRAAEEAAAQGMA